ncbi:MAG: DUF4440 domain-containing protein [Sphingobacteriales bacterium]|nr:MAG: DUF4440 domain-containing protein [Sphingobacteriales bacterium]
MKHILAILFLLLPIFSFADAKDEAAIRKMLASQAEKWNKGDVAGFMKGYWGNDSLVFIGSRGPTYGYKPTLENYKKTYPDAAHMGTLTSTPLQMKQLSKDYYFVIGKWDLKRDAGDVGGSYTLLIKKIDGDRVL